MDFLAIAHGAAGAIDAQQQHRELAFLHLAERFDHPLAGGSSDRAGEADAGDAFTALAAQGPNHGAWCWSADPMQGEVPRLDADVLAR